MKSSYNVIIIGGGILGCSTAYYLAQMGIKDIAILERNTLGSASSSRAAGLMTLVRSSESIIPFIKETYRVIPELEDLLNYKLDLRITGSLQVGSTPDSINLLNKLSKIADREGINVEFISPNASMKLVPWLKLNLDDQILYTPEDGTIDSYDLTTAYAKAAKLLKVNIFEHHSVDEIVSHKNKVIGVKVNSKFISSDSIIVAAGAWSNNLSSELSFNLPMSPVRSHYWITQNNSLFENEQPFVIIPEANVYGRKEINSLLFGYREKSSFSIDSKILPDDINGFEISSKTDQWDYLIESASIFKKFLPNFEEIELAHYLEGFSTYTPDGLFILDSSDDFKGLYALTGCSGAGLAASGGLGMALSQLVIEGKSTLDISNFKANRFGVFNPFSREFRIICENARSSKRSG